ncbi:hypothetical protein [Roseateles violae]|uniref:Membrane protein YqhR n=1 Tax=Roseateles violae TaxID=3058042 RepID=A0ABT8DSS4_9BURK|nr:hypothetical protein [Pelomonas sp. PFR6]MDN3921232.1 hypothetical protein [Pelomonas sp. PFR6]
MELQVQSHRWHSRAPDWSAAIVAGLVAGAVAMVMDLLWTTLMLGGNPWHTSHLVAAMLMGPDLLNGPTHAFSLGVVTVALLIHYGLGVLFGCAIAYVVTGFHYEGDLPVLEIVGGLAGMALYFINFYVLVNLFPWVAELRSGAYFFEHFVFGVTAAMVYWKLARRSATA